MNIRAFITHKLAETYSDCQDRFGVNDDTKSIAVSDGMGSTWQQKIWAQLLVDSFTGSGDWLPTRETIKPLCESWKNKVIDYIEQLKKRPRTGGIQQREIKLLDALIYRNERGLALGYSAGATFVGIRFEKNLWNGSVLGDSCLIEWDGSEARFHTSQDVEAFDSYPDYFDSDELKQGKGTPKAISGTLDKGGYLFLVSDPFSDFLFEHNKQGDVAEYMQKLLELSSHEEFETLVDEWRKVGMHNDDTTLVIVEYNNSDALTIIHSDDIAEMIEKEKSISTSSQETVEAESENGNGAPNVIGDALDKHGENIMAADTIEISTLPIDTDIFIEDFLTEYKRALECGCKGKSQKAIKKFWSELKYKATQDAAKEAFHTILNKYVIYAK